MSHVNVMWLDSAHIIPVKLSNVMNLTLDQRLLKLSTRTRLTVTGRMSLQYRLQLDFLQQVMTCSCPL